MIVKSGRLAGVLLVAVTLGSVVVGCSTRLPPPSAATPPTAVTPPAPASSAPAAPNPGANPDVALCRRYLTAVPSARTPLDAMRTQAVLYPFIDIIELGTHEIATQGGQLSNPMLAQAMLEVVAAQEDLDAQGTQNLPAGASPNETPVRLNPERLATALDAAEQACQPLVTR